MKTMEKPVKAVKKTNELRKWLDSIKAGNSSGLLKTGDVVEAARDPDSAGHSHFTWDDSIAGEKYRNEVEAPNLIRRVYVLVDDEGAKRPAYLSLIHDREKPGGGYRSTGDVLSSKALKAQLELTAKSELRAWTQRYQMLTGLVGPVAKAAGIELPESASMKLRKKKPR